MKKWIPILTILLVAGLVAFILEENAKDYEQAKIYQEWDYMRQPVSERLDNLKYQLDNLEEEFVESQEPKAVVQILFTELSERVYTDGFPLMDQYGYTGTLVLSPTQLPGLEGCMTEEQFDELLEEGWDVCARYEGPSVAAWWKALKPELESRELEAPEIVFFPEGTYEPSMDATLEKQGFEIAASKVSAEQSPIVLEDTAGLWHVGALGYMNQEAKIRLNESVELDGNIVYCIGFGEGDEQFQKSSLAAMLKYFDQHRASGGLMILNIDEGREHFGSRTTGNNPKYTKRYEKKKAKIEERIAEVEKQLQEIDEKYRNMK